MIWIYRALAVTALIARIFIILENAEKIRERRRLRKLRRVQKRNSEEEDEKINGKRRQKS